MNGRHRMRAGVLVALALAVAGCGAATGGAGEPGAPSTPTSRARAVTATADGAGRVCLNRPGSDADPYGEELPPAPDRTPLGAQDPVRFALCTTSRVHVSGDGDWEVRAESRTADVRALAKALREPDLAAPLGQSSCNASLEIAPELWAVDATGHAVLVRWPVDHCGFIRDDVSDVYDAVRWTSVGQRRLRQVAPQAALDSGCETGYKQMVAIISGDAARDGTPVRAGTFAALASAPGGRACVYRIDDRSQVPSGSFAAGSRLSAGAWSALVSALESAPAAAGRCTAVGDRFAVVTGTGGGDPAYVELDGCRRVLTPDGGFRQVTPTLLRLLGAR